MRIQFIDAYSRLDSPIHRWPAWLKLAVAGTGIGCLIALPFSGWPFWIVWALLLIAGFGIARIPAGFVLRRLILFEPLVLGVALLAWFQPHGGWIFLTLMAKSTLCLLTMIWLSNTTPFSHLLRILQRCRVPPLLVTTLALMYRYLFVLVDETDRMRQARASRTFRQRKRQDWKSLAAIIGVLFVRTTERAERIYAAMCARGWK